MSAHKRRSGGSKAKREIRQNKVKKAVVHPGLETGNYKPLNEHAIKKIHHTALDVLENIGISDPIPEILNHTLDKGCILGDDNRLKFPIQLKKERMRSNPYWK